MEIINIKTFEDRTTLYINNNLSCSRFPKILMLIKNITHLKNNKAL